MSDNPRPGMLVPLKNDPTRHVKLIVRRQTQESAWWAVYASTRKAVGVKVEDGKAEVMEE